MHIIIEIIYPVINFIIKKNTYYYRNNIYPVVNFIIKKNTYHVFFTLITLFLIQNILILIGSKVN